MIETTIQDPEKLETLRADSQGRVNLGVEYAGREVEILVVDSEETQSEEVPLQQTIGDRPMDDHERTGMLFVRAYGIKSTFLTDDHTAVTTEDGVDESTVAPTDVDWSYGYLAEPKNAVRFVFDEDATADHPAFSEQFTVEPVSVAAETVDGASVYRYENEAGDTSAVAAAFVTPVEQLFGYDPTEDLANVRVDPDQGPAPVLFTDPESDAYLAVAPRVE